jgi:hypothetical protein
VRRFFVLACLICSVTAKAQTCTRTNGRIHWRSCKASAKAISSSCRWNPIDPAFAKAGTKSRLASCRGQVPVLPNADHPQRKASTGPEDS